MGTAIWRHDGATRELARRRFSEEAGPCPACGAPPDVELINLEDTLGFDEGWIAGQVDCSARCYESEPEPLLGSHRPASTRPARRRDG